MALVADIWIQHLLDAWRYFTIGEGIALMLVSGVSVIDSFIYAWPMKMRIGVSFRWLGRFGLVLFITYFIHTRVGSRHVNWYTPLACLTFSLLLVGTWLTKEYEFFWKDIDGEYKRGMKEPL